MWRKLFLIALLVITGCGSACFLFADRIAAFYINTFTEYTITYDKWGENPFNRNRIDGMVVSLKDKGIGARAEEATFTLNFRDLVDKRKIVIDCDFTEVSFLAFTDSREEETGLSPEEAFNNVLDLPFKSDQPYGDVTLTLIVDTKTVQIKDFNAVSKDIKVTGDYTLYRSNNNIAVDIKISVSPEMSAKLGEDLRNNLLSPDEGGWYSTIINYKGSPLLLKALYSLAV